jgi:carboxyl-terminal processing protease
MPLATKKNGIGSDGELASDLVAVDDAMTKIMPTLKDLKGLVIDLRYNGGGEDLVAMRILSYLIDKPLLASRKKYKLANGFSQPKDIMVHPAKNNDRFYGPIVVLTSLATASAAESFALGLYARKNVTFVGAPSNGVYSDMLMKQLPNGWTFSLSNEVYLDLAGNNCEFAGLPVSQHFDYLDPKVLKSGKDPALEFAIGLFRLQYDNECP